MIGEELKTAVEGMRQRYADRRVHVFDVQVVAVENGACRLAGRVLDKGTLASLRAELARQSAGLVVDTERVQVLRRQPPQMITVATNLMGLKGEPSPGAETLSQLRAGATVEFLLQHETNEKWVFVRQQDGYLGWAYAPYLIKEASPQPSHLVGDPVALLRAEPAANSPLVSRLVAGTALAAGEKRDGWVHVALPGFRDGWLPAPSLRAIATLPGDTMARRAQMVRDAYAYTGVPYVWGGVSALGIDCSGYVQLLHHLSGVTIPRDADMQWHAGEPVEPPFAAGDLLFFGSGRGHRPISHVGMSLGGWRMIHSSGPRNGVYVDNVQEADWLHDIFVSARTFLSDGG